MDLSWILGHARTTFHASPTPVSLPLKSTKQSPATTTPLPDFCASVTPPCRLSPLLPSGHMQTMYTAFTKTDVPIWYRRRAFTSTDRNCAGTFTVDFVCERKEQEEEAVRDEAVLLSHDHTGTHFSREDAGTHGSGYLPPRTVPFTKPEWEEMEAGSLDATPMLITLHGLSGGSHELYLRECLAPLTTNAAEGEQKWKVCVINARGCAGSNITTGMLFNARATWDLRQVVNWLRVKFPNRPLFALGFSLGGNILTNYLGEEGDQCELAAAVVASNPCDLAAGSIALQSSWLGKEVYSKTMTNNLKKVFTRHIEEIARDNPKLDIERIKSSRYLHEFDRELQGPTWGYPTEGAYYRDASSVESLMAVRIPYFAIHAEDDPVAPREAQPLEEVKQNPFTVLVSTSMGGHLSWFESDGGRWFVKPVVKFLRRVAEEVDLQALARQNRAEVVQSSIRRVGAATFDPMQRKLHLPFERGPSPLP